MAIDPYRTLGLSSGATLAEVKAAYRRLAKVNHPDTAGEAAMPRFLAIQAAYEAIVSRRRDAVRRTPRTAPTPAWQAEPGRARATRDPWRTRRRPEQAAHEEPATERPAGGRPGRRRAGPAASAADGASGSPRGATGGRGRGRAPAGPSGSGGRGRQTRKATLGSTSYDDVDREPFDPEWAGGSWYGTASGTYWTLNPKEYADPRKHGPEYQARARRPIPEDDPDADGDDGTTASAEAAWSDATTTDAGRAAWSAAGATPRRAEAWASLPSRSILSRLLDPPWPPTERGLLALLGWPPIGIGVAMVVGQLTGCGRFAATCGEAVAGSATVAILIGQLAILAVLLAFPRLAAVAVAGTLTIIVTALPATVVLSAAGASREPGVAGQVLLGLMAIAWLVGVGLGFRRRAAHRITVTPRIHR
jgi:hypothetical protein